MNKKIITSLMIGTTLSGSVLAIDPVSQLFGNDTQNIPLITQISIRMGSLITAQDALSRRIDDNFHILNEKIDSHYQILNGKIDDNHQDIKSQLSIYQTQTNKQFEKIDQRFEKIDQRFEKIDQRFEKIDQQLRDLIQLLTRSTSETDYRFLEVHRNLTKVDDQTALSLVRVAGQCYANITRVADQTALSLVRVADQCYANVTHIADQCAIRVIHVAEESHQNLTKMEKELTRNASTFQTNTTARLDNLESYFYPDFYKTIITNPLLYVSLTSLALAAKSTSTLPTVMLPYASWGLYGTASACFYQMWWNFFSSSAPEHYQELLKSGLLMGIAGGIFAVQKNEARIAPHITPSAFGAGMAGLMATGVVSYGLKTSFDLVMAWVK